MLLQQRLRCFAREAFTTRISQQQLSTQYQQVDNCARTFSALVSKYTVRQCPPVEVHTFANSSSDDAVVAEAVAATVTYSD